MKGASVVVVLAALAGGVTLAPAGERAAESSTHPTTTAADSIGAHVDALFAEWTAAGSPGAAVGVIRDGDLVFARGYGAANLEYGVPITPTTPFHVASISKHFTAFAIGLLEEDGVLGLDDDVRRFVPELPDFGYAITLRHLMHHTSGLRDQWELLVMSGWRLDDVITTEHVLKTLVRQRELNFLPGEYHLYSNSGYTLLALVVERASGQSFGEFTRVRIFEPLGMHDTHFHDDHERIVPGRAYSYAPALGGGYRHTPLNYATVGATSLFTTIEDLARWDRNFSDPRVGSTDLRERMIAPGPLNGGRYINYARALVIGEYEGRATVSHGGADAGYRAHYVRFPAEGYSFVVLGNLSTIDARAAALRVADLYLGTAAEATSRRGAAARHSAEQRGSDVGASDAHPADAAPMKQDLTEYEGEYYSEELGTAYTVRVQGDRLLVEHRRHVDARLFPTAPDRFSGDQLWMRTVRFERRDDGEVTGFRLSGSRALNIRFDRVAG